MFWITWIKNEFEVRYWERWYIDHPTRDTLDNITTVENEALQRAEAIPFNGHSNSKHMMITKVLANVKATKGEELRLKVEEAVRQTHDDDEMVACAFKIVAELENIVGYHGADDEQLPAISMLPPLVAVYAGKDALHEVVESAVVLPIIMISLSILARPVLLSLRRQS